MILDPQGGKEVCTLMGHTGRVSSVSFSPDGKLVASGSDDKTVRIWDVATGKEAMAPLRGHTDSVNSVAFSPDGKLVASGSWDGTVRIWDVEKGAEAMAPLRGDKSSWVGVPAQISELAQRVKDRTTDKSRKSRSGAFLVTAQGDHVFVYSLLDDDHKLDGDNTKEAVAQYRAPANIESISCMGKCVCVGLVDGQVCKLYLNVQKHFTCAMKPVCMELIGRQKKIKKYSEQKFKNAHSM
jgi:WD40 repeat protein